MSNSSIFDKKIEELVDENKEILEPFKKSSKVTNDWEEIKINDENIKEENEDKDIDLFPKVTPIEIEFSLDFSDVKPVLTKETLKRSEWLKQNPDSTYEDYEMHENSIYNDPEIIEKEVLRILREVPELTTSEILEKLDFDTWTILEVLDKMKNEGIIE